MIDLAAVTWDNLEAARRASRAFTRSRENLSHFVETFRASPVLVVHLSALEYFLVAYGRLDSAIARTIHEVETANENMPVNPALQDAEHFSGCSLCPQDSAGGGDPAAGNRTEL